MFTIDCEAFCIFPEMTVICYCLVFCLWLPLVSLSMQEMYILQKDNVYSRFFRKRRIPQFYQMPSLLAEEYHIANNVHLPNFISTWSITSQGSRKQFYDEYKLNVHLYCNNILLLWSLLNHSLKLGVIYENENFHIY